MTCFVFLSPSCQITSGQRLFYSAHCINTHRKTATHVTEHTGISVFEVDNTVSQRTPLSQKKKGSEKERQGAHEEGPGTAPLRPRSTWGWNTGLGAESPSLAALFTRILCWSPSSSHLTCWPRKTL